MPLLPPQAYAYQKSVLAIVVLLCISGMLSMISLAYRLGYGYTSMMIMKKDPQWRRSKQWRVAMAKAEFVPLFELKMRHGGLVINSGDQAESAISQTMSQTKFVPLFEIKRQDGGLVINSRDQAESAILEKRPRASHVSIILSEC
jgi:hypothetical protein